MRVLSDTSSSLCPREKSGPGSIWREREGGKGEEGGRGGRGREEEGGGGGKKRREGEGGRGGRGEKGGVIAAGSQGGGLPTTEDGVVDLGWSWTVSSSTVYETLTLKQTPHPSLDMMHVKEVWLPMSFNGFSTVQVGSDRKNMDTSLRAESTHTHTHTHTHTQTHSETG